MANQQQATEMYLQNSTPQNLTQKETSESEVQLSQTESHKSLKDVTNVFIESEDKSITNSVQGKAEMLHDGLDMSKSEENDEYQESSELTLETLPSEILLHICSFLDAKFVIETLSKVCKVFHDIFNDKTFWKIRLRKRCPKKYPAIPVNDNEFDWMAACVEKEERQRVWAQHERNTVYFKYREGLYAAVDTVHFMGYGYLLAAGSRDRYLNVLDVRKLDLDDPDSVKDCRVFCKMDAHKGWIWSMSSLDSLLATGSWDHYVKFWDMAAEGTELRKVKCGSPVLCSHFEPSYFMAGCYDQYVYHIDPRCGELQAKKRYHQRAVLCMAADDRYVITGSEDKTVAVYDRRADRVHTTLTLPEFPLSMSYEGDQLWLGDKTGSLHLIDATDGDFNVVEKYEGVHAGKVTGVIHGLGAIFTCSTDHTVKVLEPTQRPGVIATLTNHNRDIAKIAYSRDILACASSDISIGIWAPQ